jgi:hypothetical protein
MDLFVTRLDGRVNPRINSGDSHDVLGVRGVARGGHVYIKSNKCDGTLYIGVTSDLPRL